VLSRDDLLALYECWGLPDQARAVIDQVRSSSPARRVRSGRGNVSGSYPSRKMGATIQFESHRVELAAVYEMEHDPGVLEFFDQPPSIKLLYESANRKRMGVLHTPDFFVIWQDKAGWEEWKQEEDLTRLAEKNPNRYSGTATVSGGVGRVKNTRSRSVCTMGSDQVERSIGSSKETYSSSRITCGAIRPGARPVLARRCWATFIQRRASRWNRCFALPRATLAVTTSTI